MLRIRRRKLLNIHKGGAPVPTDVIYGVDGIGRESTTLTRTDDSASFVAPASLTTLPTELHDFFVDNEDVTDSNGNHFVKLKKFCVQITVNEDGSQKWRVSHTQIDSSWVLPNYFKDKDGNVIDYAYYGKYKGYVDNNVLKSVSGVAPTYSTTIDNYRTYARANSDNYIDEDISAYFVAQCLFLVCYATTKTDSIISYRTYDATTGSNTELICGIEDLVGNGLEDLDGCSWYANGIYYKELISEYTGQVTSGKTILTTATNSYIKTKTFTKENNIVLPESTVAGLTVGGSSTTYLCDYQFFGGSSYPIVFFGADSTNDLYGLFYVNNYFWSYTGAYLGSRLQAKILI